MVKDMQKGVQIGEIHVPGSSGSTGAKTFILTNPGKNGVEVLFGFFAADTQKRLIEKLVDRLAEEARPVFFAAAGDKEARFESMLKQLNRAILVFLHEQRLSIPGIRLRGAVGALSGDELLLSNRGRLRGTLVVPQRSKLMPFDLFDEAGQDLNPKFFTALQAGTLPAGSRLFISTLELFETLDDAFVKQAFAEPDEAAATRALKTALKSASLPVSVISLSTPGGSDLAEAARETATIKPRAAVPAVERARPAKTPSRARQAEAAPALADVGELVARGVRAAFFGVGAALKLVPRAVGCMFRVVIRAARAIPAIVAVIANALHPERRTLAWTAVQNAHERFVDRHVGRLNALSPRARTHTFMIVLVAALLVHGTVFSAQRHVSAAESKAFQAGLTEFEQLKTDLDTALIYANDIRAKEIVGRMKTVLGGLPDDTEARARAKADAFASYEASLERFRKVVELDTPQALATLGGAADLYRGGPLAVFDGTLYLFSPRAGSAIAFSSDGSFSEKSVGAETTGFVAATAGNTGLVLIDASGTVVYWNPASGDTQRYEGRAGTGPMMYWQNRVYGLADDGAVVRRVLSGSTLGADVVSVPAPGREHVTAMAADGAVYLLGRNGVVEKYMRGKRLADFLSAAIEPAVASAGSLWVSPDYDRLLYVETGGDRLIMLDKDSGRLIAQYRSPAFQDLESMTVNPDTGIIYLTANGQVFSLPMDLPKP